MIDSTTILKLGLRDVTRLRVVLATEMGRKIGCLGSMPLIMMTIQLEGGGPLSTRVDEAPTPPLADWFSTQQVAMLYGASIRSVLRMIREGRLPAHKFGWVWAVHETDLPKTWPPPVKR